MRALLTGQAHACILLAIKDSKQTVDEARLFFDLQRANQ